MNDSTPDHLERRLEALSRPPTEASAHWRAALDAHRAAPPKRSVIARVGPWVGLVAAVVIVGVMLLPAVGKARRNNAGLAMRLEAEATEAFQASMQEKKLMSADLFGNESVSRDSETLLEGLHRQRGSGVRFDALQPATVASAPLEQAAAASSPRLVARRADLSLRVGDVREAFLKAQHMTNPVLGEFVEDSRITGEGPTASADLTLRIASTRLAAALDELRTLGVVVSENSTGDDVTEQAVDLDARLRNERRVEEEVLQLLDTRQAAPLPDVLKLRDTLATVRGSIERMDAQRAVLSRMVDLSTVILILRPDGAAPAAPRSKGFISDLGEQTEAAWMQGSRRLAKSLAWTIEAAVGGALTWIALAVVMILGVGITRRLVRFAALEPAPRLGS